MIWANAEPKDKHLVKSLSRIPQLMTLKKWLCGGKSVSLCVENELMVTQRALRLFICQELVTLILR